MDLQGIATAALSISASGVHLGDVGLARELARPALGATGRRADRDDGARGVVVEFMATGEEADRRPA
jgi:hypothetical protein